MRTDNTKQGAETTVSQRRQRQHDRFAALNTEKIRTNADCSGRILEETAMPDEAGLALMRQAAESLGLSARGFHRTLRAARTLADLDDMDAVTSIHIAEALSYCGETLKKRQAA